MHSSGSESESEMYSCLMFVVGEEGTTAKAESTMPTTLGSRWPSFWRMRPMTRLDFGHVVRSLGDCRENIRDTTEVLVKKQEIQGLAGRKSVI